MALTYVDKVDAVIPRERKSVAVERELDRIYKAEGTLTPETILARARSAEHPLHRYFEWDDSAAAEKYRRAQASSMILASKFVAVLTANGGVPDVVAASPVEVRKYLPQHRRDGFRMRKEILSDDDSRRYLIERKVSILRSWVRETMDIPELESLRAAIIKGIEGT